MAAAVYQLDFSSVAQRTQDASCLQLASYNVVPFSAQPLLPPSKAPVQGRRETVIAAALALGLHVIALALLPDTARKETVTPPQPIQVAWINPAKPAAEKPPAAPPKPKQLDAKPKPKLKPKPLKAKPKALLATPKPASVAAPPRIENAAPETNPAPQTPAQPPAKASPPAPSAESRTPTTLPNLNADYLHNPAPAYPEEARERGEEGKVVLRVRVNADGSVAELTLRKSSGSASLDRSALATVKKWRFVPARRGAEAVAAWVVVPINFSLEDA